jgi:hypothetical protein
MIATREMVVPEDIMSISNKVCAIQALPGGLGSHPPLNRSGLFTLGKLNGWRVVGRTPLR